MEEKIPNEDQLAEEGDDIVNPWEVASHSAKGVDYDKLISKIFPSLSYDCFTNIWKTSIY